MAGGPCVPDTPRPPPPTKTQNGSSGFCGACLLRMYGNRGATARPTCDLCPCPNTRKWSAGAARSSLHEALAPAGLRRPRGAVPLTAASGVIQGRGRKARTGADADQRRQHPRGIALCLRISAGGESGTA